MQRVTLVVAATSSNGIGLNGNLPWRLPKEMKYFAKTTSSAPENTQNAVIMGRNTWESIPTRFRPLPNRFNVIVSRNQSYAITTANGDNFTLQNDLTSTIKSLEATPKPIHRSFVIGGASLYAEFLSLARDALGYVDRVLLTRILKPAFDCDTFMPDYLQHDKDGWIRESHEALEKWVGFEVPKGVQEENGVEYEFQMWTRN